MNTCWKKIIERTKQHKYTERHTKYVKKDPPPMLCCSPAGHWIGHWETGHSKTGYWENEHTFGVQNFCLCCFVSVSLALPLSPFLCCYVFAWFPLYSKTSHIYNLCDSLIFCPSFLFFDKNSSQWWWYLDGTWWQWIDGCHKYNPGYWMSKDRLFGWHGTDPGRWMAAY